VKSRVLSVGRTAAIMLAAAMTVAATAAFTPTSGARETTPVPAETHTPTPRSITHADGVVREHFRLVGSPFSRIFPNADNYAARSSPNSPLLLFLPATGHHPSQYRDFLSTARDAGYHVLALDYWNNGKSVARTCGMNSDCYTEVQRNRLDGSDPSRFSSVNPANSIVTRLRDSLLHLQRVDASGNWQQFVHGHTIDWQNIVVAGHSQGGGEAAFISHLHPVRGVLMFSSPVESDHGINASWMASAGATPPSRMYGLDDSGDMFSSRVIASWNALGMGAFGSVADVDAGVPSTSHELVSHLDLGTPEQAHLRDITDDVPLVQGKPVYAAVWRWMLARPLQARDSATTS
jgi:pimeloyl-ACP methyl ester carboxylesterase